MAVAFKYRPVVLSANINNLVTVLNNDHLLAQVWFAWVLLISMQTKL